MRKRCLIMFNAKMLKTIGMALGIVAIILAIVIFTMDIGSYESNEYYGGDAYTGIQQAAAQTANNVQEVGKMLRFGIGSIVMLHGLVLLLGSLCIKAPETAAINICSKGTTMCAGANSTPKKEHNNSCTDISTGNE